MTDKDPTPEERAEPVFAKMQPPRPARGNAPPAKAAAGAVSSGPAPTAADEAAAVAVPSARRRRSARQA